MGPANLICACLLHVAALQLILLVGGAVGFSGPIAGCSTEARQRPFWKKPLQLSLFNGFGFDKGFNKEDSDDEMLMMEKEVVASAQAKVDKQTARKALTTALSDGSPARTQATPQWAAALAASVAAGVASFLALHNIAVGLVVAASVGFVANRNPLEEEDSAGAIARTVGRYTLASVEAATPKAKAIARAALIGQEEVEELQERLQDLETQYTVLQGENTQLRLWKERRLWVDQVLSTYNLQELKELARRNELQVGGTKAQLLMRLVEAEAIDPDL